MPYFNGYSNHNTEVMFNEDSQVTLYGVYLKDINTTYRFTQKDLSLVETIIIPGYQGKDLIQDITNSNDIGDTDKTEAIKCYVNNDKNIDAAWTDLLTLNSAWADFNQNNAQMANQLFQRIVAKFELGIK